MKEKCYTNGRTGQDNHDRADRKYDRTAEFNQDRRGEDNHDRADRKYDRTAEFHQDRRGEDNHDRADIKYDRTSEFNQDRRGGDNHAYGVKEEKRTVRHDRTGWKLQPRTREGLQLSDTT